MSAEERDGDDRGAAPTARPPCAFRRRQGLHRAVRWPLPVLFLPLLAVVLPFALGLLPTVRFVSERIDIDVYPAELRVDGRYRYRNPFPFPVRQAFAIPFPVDGDHPEPTGVRVMRLTPEPEVLPIALRGATAVFEAAFPAGAESEIRVEYRQAAGGNRGSYILTTTQPWHRPLQEGLYVLHPRGTAILSSNYPVDPAAASPAFFREDFMPLSDWHFTWRCNDAVQP